MVLFLEKISEAALLKITMIIVFDSNVTIIAHRLLPGAFVSDNCCVDSLQTSCLVLSIIVQCGEARGMHRGTQSEELLCPPPNYA